LTPRNNGPDFFRRPGRGLQAISFSASVMPVNAKRRRTLVAVFARPTSSAIAFSDIESLARALGGAVEERAGSRVRIEIRGEVWRCHRPHPGREARRYQVEEFRELLLRLGVAP